MQQVQTQQRGKQLSHKVLSHELHCAPAGLIGSTESLPHLLKPRVRSSECPSHKQDSYLSLAVQGQAI